MAFNRFKIPRLGLGELPIGLFGTFATLGLNLYMLPHEVVKTFHLRPFWPISVIRGVLHARISADAAV